MANYLYNGVELPALPEWDRESYPYAVMSIVSAGHATLYLIAEPSNLTLQSSSGSMSLGVKAGVTYLRSRYMSGDSFPVPVEVTPTTDNLFTDSPDWANYDVLNADGTVYLAASEPVPVTTTDPQSTLMGYLVGCRL